MKKLLVASLAALALAFGAIISAAPGNAAPDLSYIPGKIIVKFRDNGVAASVLRQHGLSDGPGIGNTGARLITVPAGRELQLIEALSRNRAVEYAETDQVATVASHNADVDYFPSQYALQNVGQPFTSTSAGTPDADVDAVEAWVKTTGIATADTAAGIAAGTRIKVAVLDTGVTNDNPDITPKVVAWDNFSTGVDNDDKYGHGTHVAGIIAAAKDAKGVSGVCPDCLILDGKVLNDDGSGSTSSIANGIGWAVDLKAQVINMSLGQRVSSRTLEIAVNKAWDAGRVIVAAAGNTGVQAKFYPAAYPNVIAVAATDNNDAKASFSTYGKWVDVAAPGVNVYSTFPNHGYTLGVQNNLEHGFDILSGTSMASPIAAGVAALVWSLPATTSNAAVRAKVESTADPIKGTGAWWAKGRVNACKAVGASGCAALK